MIDKIALSLNKDYAHENPLFLIILKGGFVFGADLIRKFKSDCEVEFVKIKSYEGQKSTGSVIIDHIPESAYKGRNVVIVEDIIDTGKTLHEFINQVEKFNPKSLKLVTLFKKSDSISHDVNIDYFGFDLPNKFIVGFGLDLDGVGRNLPHIFVLKGG